MLIQENINLKNFNTFHVSAYARYFSDITKVDDLLKALDFSQQQNIPFMIIGQGSNLLFKEDYAGLIIELNIKGIERVAEDDSHYFVKAQCGENWHDFVQHCLQAGYYGLENLSLIPGSVGAAPVQNIGAYAVEVADFLHELEALEISSGKLIQFTKEDCQLAYRHSIFKAEFKDRFVITDVTFKLLKQAQLNLTYPALRDAFVDIKAENITPLLVSEAVCKIRRSKLPDPGVLGNAGSFFRNPIISAAELKRLQNENPKIVAYPYEEQYKLAAAWLIDQAGWKGYREGDIGVHKEHALVLVNYAEASGAELYDLSVRIQQSVLKMFGIELQPEVRII
ncbi:UDP-N-acetylmuramate dehydrogenase [Haliea sp. AH-315-K21]|uniref:UDP-N-acetylenolpyruvoylglucosamine reductase n=1 Tax=SAR86 cluster bacterium TaxID=2030880 RepID=A0A2A5C9M7_9GAMM|nr:UDP-N-acetylmuramate dehydrogenase [Haliea sp. AH-315-K21]PCJ40453.1 MAG: UDP-N-acetylenolpyruvoylglucosamine reductase [SAR86 cluster bacterium]